MTQSYVYGVVYTSEGRIALDDLLHRTEEDAAMAGERAREYGVEYDIVPIPYFGSPDDLDRGRVYLSCETSDVGLHLEAHGRRDSAVCSMGEPNVQRHLLLG